MGVYYYGAVAVASILLGTAIGVGTGLGAIRVMEAKRHVAPLQWRTPRYVPVAVPVVAELQRTGR